MAADRKWDGTTYGNSLMHRWLIALLRRIDTRVFYCFAYVFVIPPCLFRPGFRPIYRYFRRVHRLSPLGAFIKTYQNHCVFAETVIDKFAMYAGKRFHIDVEGYDHYVRRCQREEGFVMLSSHIGCYEIAGYTLVADRKPINALIFLGEKDTVIANRKKLFAHTNIRMIAVRQDMSHLFEIDSVLNRGEIVSIPGDRIWGSTKEVTETLLGQEVHLPQGPYRVVASRGLDAIAVHVMKTSWTHYQVYVTPIDYDKTAPRSKQVDQLAGGFAAEMERMLDLYPTQWFNYFDFFEYGTESIKDIGHSV